MKKFTLLCILTIFSCVCCNNAWSQDYFSGNTYYDVKGRAYYYTNEGKAYYYPESVPQENIVGNAHLNNSELDKNFLDADWWKTATPEDVELEIKNGANVNAVADAGDMEGATVLAMALVVNKNPKIVKMLIDAGADVNHKMTINGDHGLTSLIIATIKPNTEIIKMLIDAGADVNARIESGERAGFNALMLVIKYDYSESNLEIIKMLIDAGADVNAKTEDGYTVMDVALDYYNSKIIELLKNAGAKENQDKQNERIIDSIATIIVNIQTMYATQNDYEGLTTEVADEIGLIPQNVIKEKINIRVSDVNYKGDNKAFILQVNELSKDACIGIALSDWGNNVKFGTQKLGKYQTTPLTVGNATEACDCIDNQCTILLKGQ